MDRKELTGCRLVSQEGRWRPFIIRPTPSPLMKPLLVFVNPKSGGNQVNVALPLS